jgi:hypothetical protein
VYVVVLVLFVLLYIWMCLVFSGVLVVVYLCVLWFFLSFCAVFSSHRVVVFIGFLCGFFLLFLIVWIFFFFSSCGVGFYISCGCRCGILVYIVSKICSFCCFADECFIVGIWILVKLCLRSWS